MAIGYKEITKLTSKTLLEYNNQSNLQFCELGNNYLKGPKLMEWLKLNNINLPIGGEQHSTGIVSKSFWESIGFNHTSLDLNGFDGSVKIDLRYPIIEKWKNQFDILYDGGTGEHVDNQYNFFKNCHNLVKEKGLMVHILPKVGYFPKHCSYYYTLNTFKYLIEFNDYELKELFEHDADGGVMIYSSFKKKNNKNFMSEKEFKEIPIKFVGHNANDKNLYPYAYK